MKLIIGLILVSGMSLAESKGLDFNAEINQISSEQFTEHLKTLEHTKVTEAAIEFENSYRKPTVASRLTDVTIKIYAK